jgi:hypothetical protein
MKGGCRLCVTAVTSPQPLHIYKFRSFEIETLISQVLLRTEVYIVLNELSLERDDEPKRQAIFDWVEFVRI